MAESPHYSELLRNLNEESVEYLIVGGYAVMKYTEPRYTKDLDVWVGNSLENSAKLYRALAKFGAPLTNDGIDPMTFTQDDLIYQIGVPPARIDILTHITGVRFEDAWQQRVPSLFSGIPVHFISLNDLIRNKETARRKSDLSDLKRIRKETQREN
jgi:predicted nucleotidyltransferase